MTTLRLSPTPLELSSMKAPAIVKGWKTQMNRQPRLKKSQLLIELAKHSVGTQQALKIYKLHLEQLFEEFDLATSQLERVEKEVTDILKEIPLARKLLALRNEKGLRNFKMMPINNHSGIHRATFDSFETQWTINN